jgi:hypothetical protein
MNPHQKKEPALLEDEGRVNVNQLSGLAGALGELKLSESRGKEGARWG